MDQKVYVKGKPVKCPACGWKPVANILYGEPIYTEKLYDDLSSGRIVLGGCCIEPSQPLWYCTNCETDFYKAFDGKNL